MVGGWVGGERETAHTAQASLPATTQSPAYSAPPPHHPLNPPSTLNHLLPPPPLTHLPL